MPPLTGLRASGVSALGLLDDVLKERGIWGANGELKAASERELPCPVAYAAAIQHPSTNPALQDPILLALSAHLGGRAVKTQISKQNSEPERPTLVVKRTFATTDSIGQGREQ